MKNGEGEAVSYCRGISQYGLGLGIEPVDPPSDNILYGPWNMDLGRVEAGFPGVVLNIDKTLVHQGLHHLLYEKWISFALLVKLLCKTGWDVLLL